MAKSKYSERVSFRTTKTKKRMMSRLASKQGHRTLSDYIREKAEAPILEKSRL